MKPEIYFSINLKSKSNFINYGDFVLFENAKKCFYKILDEVILVNLNNPGLIEEDEALELTLVLDMIDINNKRIIEEDIVIHANIKVIMEDQYLYQEIINKRDKDCIDLIRSYKKGDP